MCKICVSIAGLINQSQSYAEPKEKENIHHICK